MLLAILAIALGVTICSKWFADRASTNAALERLSSTSKLCVNATYPLTPSVLTQIQDLSGLRLAIVLVGGASENDSDHSLEYESQSSSFPGSTPVSKLQEICRDADGTAKQPFLKVLDLGQEAWNALAVRLPNDSAKMAGKRFLVLIEPVDKSRQASVQAFVLPLVTGLFSAAAIAIVATVVVSRIGRRVERLRTHVESIAGGAFETIQPNGPIDTIHSLYQSVNVMSQQLKRSAAEIAQNERSRLINLIASGLAHELRNHLTGAKLAIQTCDADEGSREALSIAQKQMHLAEESIQRLLALRVGSNIAVTPEMSESQIVFAVRELTQPMAQHRRVAFEVKVSSDGELMIPDGNSVVGAIINLVLNAFEAAGPGGKVELRQSHEQASSGNLSLWIVRDNGPGPSAEIAESMFEPFATTKREGVGLGLAMCKRIAHRLHGDVYWKRVDGWTEFVFKVGTTINTRSE